MGMKDKDEPCLRCGKPRGPRGTRGLCAADYVTLCMAVKYGTTTWEAMEAAGKILPNQRTKRRLEDWLEKPTAIKPRAVR